VAGLNTHDTPTAAAFLLGLDIQDRQSMGLLSDTERDKALSRRSTLRDMMIRFFGLQSQTEQTALLEKILQRWLAYLASSQARYLLVNLEDLWLESNPQNMPGTGLEYPNWRRKSRYALEEFSGRADVVETLRRIDGLRKRNG
jgi:4-alpha-glucanotransferase